MIPFFKKSPVLFVRLSVRRIGCKILVCRRARILARRRVFFGFCDFGLVMLIARANDRVRIKFSSFQIVIRSIRLHLHTFSIAKRLARVIVAILQRFCSLWYPPNEWQNSSIRISLYRICAQNVHFTAIMKRMFCDIVATSESLQVGNNHTRQTLRHGKCLQTNSPDDTQPHNSNQFKNQQKSFVLIEYHNANSVQKAKIIEG